ncbi:STYKc [Musa troglodytarum]|uniref:STYKc n=1 Tax=Musa troglodytarum TaxID=320322 RepID=A0A9E7JEP0_9LILI|nr:STYKc [Musa troglodytarum]
MHAIYHQVMGDKILCITSSLLACDSAANWHGPVQPMKESLRTLESSVLDAKLDPLMLVLSKLVLTFIILDLSFEQNDVTRDQHRVQQQQRTRPHSFAVAEENELDT